MQMFITFTCILIIVFTKIIISMKLSYLIIDEFYIVPNELILKLQKLLLN